MQFSPLKNYCVAVSHGDTNRPHLFANQVQVGFPWINMLLLTDCCPDVLHELSQNYYTLALTGNLGVACKEPLTRNEVFENQFFVGFNAFNSFTVTFATYSSLYSLENDMGMLQSVPRYGHHLFVLQFTRNINWKQMVLRAARGLHIQFPRYHSSHCSTSANILCLGWQCHSPVPDNNLSVGPFFAPLVSTPVYIYNTQQVPQKYDPYKRSKRLPQPPVAAPAPVVVAAPEEKKDAQTTSLLPPPPALPSPPPPTKKEEEMLMDEDDDWVLHAEL